MFKLAIEVCFENHFGLIRAMFLSLGSMRSVYFFWDTRYYAAHFFMVISRKTNLTVNLK